RRRPPAVGGRAAAPRAAPRRVGRRSRCPPLATLAAAPLDHVPAASCAHARAKPVGTGPLALLRLIRPLHDRRGSIRTRREPAAFFSREMGAPPPSRSEGGSARPTIGRDAPGDGPARPAADPR